MPVTNFPAYLALYFDIDIDIDKCTGYESCSWENWDKHFGNTSLLRFLNSDTFFKPLEIDLSSYWTIDHGTECSCHMAAGSTNMANMTVSVAVDGTQHNVGVHHLDIYQLDVDIPSSVDGSTYHRLNGTRWQADLWPFDGSVLTWEQILQSSVCMKDGSIMSGESGESLYFWGFSSLLLLTFCCYTLVFAATLVVLQGDVYWNSQASLDGRQHNIYSDVLFLASRLKSQFGSDLENLSADEQEKQIKKDKRGIDVEMSGASRTRLQLLRQQQLDDQNAAWHTFHGGVLRNLNTADRMTAADRFSEWKLKRRNRAAIRSNDDGSGSSDQTSTYELRHLRPQERTQDAHATGSETPNEDWRTSGGYTMIKDQEARQIRESRDMSV